MRSFRDIGVASAMLILLTAIDAPAYAITKQQWTKICADSLGLRSAPSQDDVNGAGFRMDDGVSPELCFKPPPGNWDTRLKATIDFIKNYPTSSGNYLLIAMLRDQRALLQLVPQVQFNAQADHGIHAQDARRVHKRRADRVGERQHSEIAHRDGLPSQFDPAIDPIAVRRAFQLTTRRVAGREEIRRLREGFVDQKGNVPCEPSETSASR